MIIVYLDTKDSILLKSKDSSFHVLYYILSQINHDTLVWYADKINKEEILTKVNIKQVTLDKHIASLRERDILLVTNVKGRYLLNTEIFTI